MKNDRSLVLAATAMETAELRTIFSDQPNSLRSKLEDPPKLRSSGWGLQTLDRAKFVRGELIRVGTGRMVLDLYRDGSLILVGHVNRNFLAWSDQEDLQLHPLALIELATNFTRFYRLVLDDFRATPERIGFKIELRNMHLANGRTRLREGPSGSLLWHGGMEAPENGWSTGLVVQSATYDPDRVAFSLIRELYLWFGHTDEAIPYTKGAGDGRVVDAAQIATIR